MRVIPAQGRLGQEDPWSSLASLGKLVNFRSQYTHARTRASTHTLCCFKLEDGKMVQRLRICTALAEDPFGSQHPPWEAHNHLQL